MSHKIIALAGKGGVGKTTISAAMVRILCQRHPDAQILAIDADPAVGLATALGVDVTLTLDDIRTRIISQAEDGKGREAVELLSEARYQIFDAVVEKDNFSFLAIGRPERAGCYCSINSYLKDVIEMVSRKYDYIVIDGEAGIEQINRRVMEKVTHLFLVTDASKKGTSVIESIHAVADELVMYEKCGAIINRIEDMSIVPYIKIKGIDVVSVIPSDLAHAKNDVLGNTVFDLPENTPVLQGAAQALDALNIE